MKTFSALLAICAGNSPVTGEFPTHRPVKRSFDISLICARINGWVNNREAGDLGRHRAHYDVNVMEVFHLRWPFHRYSNSFVNECLAPANHITIMASRITRPSSVCLIVCSGSQQRNVKVPLHCPFVRVIHWWTEDSPHERTVTLKMLSFDDVIMFTRSLAERRGNAGYITRFCLRVCLCAHVYSWVMCAHRQTNWQNHSSALYISQSCLHYLSV